MLCRYLELLFCKSCRGTNKRPLPWRMIHLQDFKPQKVGGMRCDVCHSLSVPVELTVVVTRHQVSNAAAEFLDAVWEHPLLDLTVVAPNLLHSHKKLAMMAQARIDMNTAVVRVGRAAVLTRVLAHPTDRVLSGNWRSRKMQSMCCRAWCHRTCAIWWSTRRSCRLPT